MKLLPKPIELPEAKAGCSHPDCNTAVNLYNKLRKDTASLNRRGVAMGLAEALVNIFIIDRAEQTGGLIEEDACLGDIGSLIIACFEVIKSQNGTATKHPNTDPAFDSDALKHRYGSPRAVNSNDDGGFEL